MTLSALTAEVAGSVLVEGNSGYDRERSGWNLLHQRMPDVIVVPSTPHDVVAAVRWASEGGLPIAVQSSGHGQSGPPDGGVLINTRAMTGVTVDATSRTARVEGGVRLGSVLQVTAEHGLAPLMGSSATVGSVGYLTGGGLPILGRKYGYAADHVRAVEMVTADGKHRKVTPDQEADLFWAVRGGLCNYGVVTAAEIDLMPLPALYGGQLVYPGDRVAEVLPAWIEWCRRQPDDMCSSIVLFRVPDAPFFPADVRGQFLIFVRIAYTGDADSGERLVEPLRSLGPVGANVTMLPIDRLPEIPADPTDPLPVVERAFRMNDLDLRGVERIVELAGPNAENPPTLFQIHHLGGALGRPPQVSNPVGLRRAAWMVSMPTVVPEPAQVERAHQAHDAVIEALRPWRAGGPHPNFVSPSGVAAGELRESYEATDYARLQELKRQWDPENLFRLNRNIPPVT